MKSTFLIVTGAVSFIHVTGKGPTLRQSLSLLSGCWALALSLILVIITSLSALGQSFRDDFSNSTLDPAWQVVSGEGYFSLTDHPGFLRYYLEGPTAYSGGWRTGYSSTGWTPSTTLLRSFDGSSWTLDTNVSYTLHDYFGSGGSQSDSTGAQYFDVYIAFGSGINDYVLIDRGTDYWYSTNILDVSLVSGGNTIAYAQLPGAAATSDGYVRDSYFWRVTRDGQSVSVLMSADGTNYTPLVTGQLTSDPGTSNTVIFGATVWASWNSYADVDYMSVQALSLKSLSLNPSTVVGSRNATGKLTLSSPAPMPFTVTLTSSDPVAVPPTSVTIPMGASSATFLITTSAVASNHPCLITATYGGISKSATLKVRPIGVQALYIVPNSVLSGDNAIGAVTLEAHAAPGPVTVTLTSSDPTVAQPVDSSGSPLSSLTIPAGTRSAPFYILTDSVSANTVVTLTATANGITKTSKLTVTP